MSLAVLVGGQADSCEGRCDGDIRPHQAPLSLLSLDPYDSSAPCQCNSACGSHGDCCDDYSECHSDQSCQGRCDAGYLYSLESVKT